MGLRIFKQIGYGIDDIRYSEKNGYIDDRLNLEEFYKIINSKKYCIDNFVNNYTNDIFLKNQYKKLDIKCKWDDVINFGYKEFNMGMPNLLIITPISLLPTWTRYDDIFDYLESNDMLPHLKKLNNGIFPYNSIWQDSNGNQYTGRNHSIANEFYFVDNMFKYPEFNKNELKNISIARFIFAQHLGFDSIESAYNGIVPMIPDEIREMCKYTKLFKNNDTINLLRPMIYTYWD